MGGGGMSEYDRDLPRCSGIKTDGVRCERVVSSAGELCYSHDPTKAAERKATASKGGKLSRKGNPAEDVVALRERLIGIADDVEASKLPNAKGQVLATVLGVAMRSFEVERKQREHDELRKEVE